MSDASYSRTGLHGKPLRDEFRSIIARGLERPDPPAEWPSPDDVLERLREDLQAIVQAALDRLEREHAPLVRGLLGRVMRLDLDVLADSRVGCVFENVFVTTKSEVPDGPVFSALLLGLEGSAFAPLPFTGQMALKNVAFVLERRSVPRLFEASALPLPFEHALNGADLSKDR